MSDKQEVSSGRARNKINTLLAVAIIFSGDSALAQHRHITRTQLEEMFVNIQAKTTWDLDGNMLWGYFFTSANKGELEKIGAELVGIGYRLMDIREGEPDTPQAGPEWQLHVERIEHHTVDTLSATNGRLESLADRHESVIYDGMDVGPIK